MSHVCNPMMDGPRPKAMALSILVDWSNQDKSDNSAVQGVNIKSASHPCWMCIHFGPPPSALLQPADRWQLTMNIYSAERVPIVKQQNEEPIPKERRALLWFNGQPFAKYRYAVVMPHCRFPSSLMPGVIAFHADRAEPYVSALMWVRKRTIPRQRKEDSYLRVVRGHTYHLHMTFPDGALLNQYIAQNWGFTASLFTFERRHGHITPSPYQSVTQITAAWLDRVEADPDVDELDMARVARLQDERDDQEALAEEKAGKSGPASWMAPSVFESAKRYYEAAEAEAVGYFSGPVMSTGYFSGPVMSTTPFNPNSHSHFTPNSSSSGISNNFSSSNSSSSSSTTTFTTTSDPSSDRAGAILWSQSELDAVVFAPPGSTGRNLPGYDEMRHYKPRVDFGPEVDSFFDAPSIPSASPAVTAMMGRVAGMYASAPMASSGSASAYISASDKETLSLFRALENKAKSVAGDSNSKLRDAAVRLTQVLSASGQFLGWQHVERFMMNPDNYTRRPRPSTSTSTNTPSAVAVAATSTSTASTESDKKKQETQGEIDKLTDKSQELIINAMIRTKWVLEIEKRHTEANKQQSDGRILERVLGALLKDTKWMADSEMLVKNAEQQVSKLISDNPGAFAKFRELQSRGVQWPHSSQLRTQIERAGFVYRPMMIKRDRCVCDNCGVEISGWRLWQNPWLFHDWSKRHPFAPPAGVLSRPTTTMDTQ